VSAYTGAPVTFKGIRPRDLVQYRTPQGQTAYGRAQALLLFAEHVVVNRSGTYGQPAVVNALNYVSHKRSTWGIRA
jgi:hypothetical protein